MLAFYVKFPFGKPRQTKLIIDMNQVTANLRLLITFIISILSFCNNPTQAQSIANYALTRTTGITYATIANTGTPPSSWRNSGAFIDDDNRSNPIDIGFDF